MTYLNVTLYVRKVFTKNSKKETVRESPLIPLALQCDDQLIFSLLISGTKLVPKMSNSNLAKPTFLAFKTVDGFKFSISLLPVPIDFVL